MNGVPWCFLNTTNLPEGIPDEQRVNCIPEGGFSPNTCSDRDCIFASTNSPDAPLCYFDVSYKLKDDQKYNNLLTLVELCCKPIEICIDPNF